MSEDTRHWSKQKEEAAGYWQLKFLLVLFRCLPVILLKIIAFPVGFFYFLFSKRGRIESYRFLKKIAPLIENPLLAKKCISHFGPLRHIVSFSLSVLEKMQAWSGKFSFSDICFQDDDIKKLLEELEAGKGVVLLFSHLGNAMLLQGLLNTGQTGVSRKISVTAIMDMKVNAHFSRVLKELNPQSDIDLIYPDDIGAQTVIQLEEKISKGELVLIAADRTSLGGKNFMLPFIGKKAPFSSGIFYLVSLLKAPVYFIFGLRHGDLSIKPKYNMHVHGSPLSFDCRRKERQERSYLLAESFTELLEKYCKKYPFQWYNFFNFWNE